MPADDAKIVAEALFLLELALSVGQMSNDGVDQQCRNFLTILLARRNISFGSVWIRSSALRQRADSARVELITALPEIRAVAKIVPVDHPGMKVLNCGEFHVARDTDSDFDLHLLETNVSAGAILSVRLRDIGVLRLYSENQDSFRQRTVNQLFPVVEIFSTSIENALTRVQLLESENRFRDFADVAADWFWEQDADLRFTDTHDDDVFLAGLKEVNHFGKTWRETNILDVSAEEMLQHEALLLARKPFQTFASRRGTLTDKKFTAP